MTGAGLLPAAVASPECSTLRNHHVVDPVDPGQPPLPLGDDFRVEAGIPVPRHRDFPRLGLGDYRLGPVAVAGIAAVAAGRVVLGISASEVNLPQRRRVTLIEVRRRDRGGGGGGGGAGPASYPGVRYGPGMRLPGPGGFRAGLSIRVCFNVSSEDQDVTSYALARWDRTARLCVIRLAEAVPALAPLLWLILRH